MTPANSIIMPTIRHIIFAALFCLLVATQGVVSQGLGSQVASAQVGDFDKQPPVAPNSGILRNENPFGTCGNAESVSFEPRINLIEIVKIPQVYFKQTIAIEGQLKEENGSYYLYPLDLPEKSTDNSARLQIRFDNLDTISASKIKKDHFQAGEKSPTRQLCKDFIGSAVLLRGYLEPDMQFNAHNLKELDSLDEPCNIVSPETSLIFAPRL